MISNKSDQLKQITAIFSAFMIGFTSMAGQLVLMREMIIVFYGNELSIGVILATWLFWVALGSSVLGRITDRIKWRLNALLTCQYLFFFILPLSIFVARNIRNIIGVSPGELIGFRPIIISAFLVLMPICILIGFAFSLTCRILADIRSQSAVSIGQVYIFEAVGASVGGLLANFVLIEFLNPYQIAFLVGTLSILCGIFLKVSHGSRRSDFLLVAASLVVIVVGWTFSGRLHDFSSRQQWHPLNLKHTENSVYGNIAVTKMDDQYSFYENGLLMFTTKDQLSSEENVHFAMLEHPEPKNVLLIGGGVGGSLEQILKHPVEHVDYVELDPMIIDVTKKYLSEAEQKPLFDERVQIHHIDARRFIKTSYILRRSHPQMLLGRNTQHAIRNPDLVIVNLPDPFTALLNRFYSLEFFYEVEEILADRGVLALSMTSSENYLNQEQREFMRSLYATLSEVFDDVKVLPGGRNYFIAQKLDNSKDPDTTYDASVLVDRLKERQLDAMYVHEYYLPYRLSPDRVNQIKSVLEGEGVKGRKKEKHATRITQHNIIKNLSGKVTLNHDFRPIGYFYDMQLWGTQFSQQSFWIKFVRAISRLNFWHVFIGIVVLFAFVLVIQFKWKRTIRFPVILSIGTTGFSEMLFQVVVILSFQVLYGYVYHKLSLILAAFMLGLVGGSWLINRTMDRLKNPVRTYILTQVSICIYPLILLSILLMAKTSIILHLATPFALLPIIAGFIGGVQFPLANKIVLEEKAKTEFSHSAVGGLAGLIYGIDLLGSCAGALLASAILVPILGVFQTCLLVTLLNAMVFVSILLARRG